MYYSTISELDNETSVVKKKVEERTASLLQDVCRATGCISTDPFALNSARVHRIVRVHLLDLNYPYCIHIEIGFNIYSPMTKIF